MPDIYSTIASADAEMAERIASVLEIRAADPQQQRMLRSYLGEIEFQAQARVLESGCGTGAVTRQLATWHNVAQVSGRISCILPH